MTALRLPFILVIAGLLAIGSIRAADVMIVRLYDYADVSARDIASLTGTTRFGIRSLRHPHRLAALSRGARGAASGRLRSSDPGQRNRIAPSTRRSPATNQGATLSLGHALIVDGGGSYVSVFVPAVRAQAAAFGVAFDLLMGYAAAHEIGHCMLGPGHSYAGLMRGAWDLKDAGQMSRLGLRLTKQQAQKAAARLSLAEPLVIR